MPHTIKEQVGEKRSTICTHGYANFLLKNAPTKHNKYVVNQTLEYIDNIGFRIRSFHNSLRNTGFVTRVTLWMPHVEQELFAPVFILSQWVHVVHVVKLFVFTLLVPYCDVLDDFCVKTMLDSSHLFCRGSCFIYYVSSSNEGRHIVLV